MPNVAQGKTGSISGQSLPAHTRFADGQAAAPAKSPGATGLAGIVPREGLQFVLFLLVLFSISRIHQHYGFLGAIRPGATLLALGGLFALVKPRSLDFAGFSTRPVKVVIAIVALACISVPFGISMGNSAKFLLDAYFRMLAVYLLVLLAIRGPRDLAHFVWAFVIAVGILAWMAIFVFDLGGAPGQMMRLGNMYMYDANDLGVLLLMGIPLALVVMDSSGRIGRVFSGVLLVAIGIALARSGSRGAFLGLVSLAGAFVIWASHIDLTKRLTAVAVILLGVIVAAPPGYWDQMKSLQNPKDDYNWSSESGRRQLAMRGFGYMLRYPVTGVGISNFSKAEWQVSSMAQEVGRRRGIAGKAAHNTWIQIGAELGVTGLVLWLTLLFGTIFAVGRTRKQLPVSWKRGPPDQRLLYSLSFYLPLAIWAFAVPSTFVSHAYMDPMYFLATLSAGYLVAVRRELQKERNMHAGPGRSTPRHA
jgi:O-antigen ligase